MVRKNFTKEKMGSKQKELVVRTCLKNEGKLIAKKNNGIRSPKRDTSDGGTQKRRED